MIEAYLHYAVTQMSIQLIIICSCLMLIWHAIEIHRFSKTFKEFLKEFIRRSAIITILTIVGVIVIVMMLR